MKPTWTLLPDVPQSSGKLPLEEMQEEYLIERIGGVRFAALCEREKDERTNLKNVEG
jgi:hypothetical protein